MSNINRYQNVQFQLLKIHRQWMPSRAQPSSVLERSIPIPPSANNDATLDVVGASQQFNLLLDLPPEIRIAVYEAVLTASHASLSLLRTCRHIHMEVQDVIYQRPTSFTSQANFFAWIDRSRARSLNRVRTVTLRLTDVDLTPLFNSNASRRQTRTSTWSLYKSDLDRLEQALSALPNLTRLTIIPPRIGRSHLLRNMYHCFLSQIPRRCLKLRQLELHDSETILDAVPALTAVRSITFTESNSTSAMASKEGRRETARISTVAADVSAKTT